MNLETLPQLAQDKANHYIYGGIIALVSAAFGPAALAPLGIALGAIWCAAIGAVAAGAMKEVWDKVSGKGDPNVWDFLATCSGAPGIMLALWMGRV